MPLTRSTEAFERIYVDYAVPGSATVTWEVRKSLLDTQPWTFQLQVNRDGGGETWSNVGSAVVNAYTAIDDTQRQYGKSLRLGYRVVLTTPEDTYTSNEAQVLGKLSKRQWLQARAIRRRATLEARGLTSLPGYLMKRKLYGTACTVCIDPITKGILNSDCTTCNGTGMTDGYWTAVQDTMIDIQPEGNDTKRSQTGTVNDIGLMAKFVAPPMMHRNDIWIDANSDRRYVVHAVKSLAEVNRVPVVIAAELRLAEFNDVIYTIDPTEGS